MQIYQGPPSPSPPSGFGVANLESKISWRLVLGLEVQMPGQKVKGGRDSEPLSLQFRCKRLNSGQTENWTFVVVVVVCK